VGELRRNASDKDAENDRVASLSLAFSFRSLVPFPARAGRKRALWHGYHDLNRLTETVKGFGAFAHVRLARWHLVASSYQ
jgi:hypothetical protein